MIENIIAIAGAAIICACTVTFFVGADKAQLKAADIMQASSATVSTIEEFKSAPFSSLPEDRYFDANWNLLETIDETATFRLFAEMFHTRNLGAAAVTSFSRYYGETSNVDYVRSSIYYEFSVGVENILTGEILSTYSAVKYEKSNGVD